VFAGQQISAGESERKLGKCSSEDRRAGRGLSSSKAFLMMTGGIVGRSDRISLVVPELVGGATLARLWPDERNNRERLRRDGGSNGWFSSSLMRRISRV